MKYTIRYAWFTLYRLIGGILSPLFLSLYSMAGLTEDLQLIKPYKQPAYEGVPVTITTSIGNMVYLHFLLLEPLLAFVTLIFIFMPLPYHSSPNSIQGFILRGPSIPCRA